MYHRETPRDPQQTGVFKLLFLFRGGADFQRLVCGIPALLFLQEDGTKTQMLLCVQPPVLAQQQAQPTNHWAKELKTRQTDLEQEEYHCSRAWNLHARSQLLVNHTTSLVTLFFGTQNLPCTLCLFLSLARPLHPTNLGLCSKMTNAYVTSIFLRFKRWLGFLMTYTKNK